MKTENEKFANFDERQLQIRGDIFKHSLFAAFAVLLINAFLQSKGVVWANGFQQNILMMIFIMTVGTVEFIMRGVYFGNGGGGKVFVAAISSGSVFLPALCVLHYAKGEKFLAGHTLTDNGFHFVFGLMISISSICSLVQALREKKAERDN